MSAPKDRCTPICAQARRQRATCNRRHATHNNNARRTVGRDARQPRQAARAPRSICNTATVWSALRCARAQWRSRRRSKRQPQPSTGAQPLEDAMHSRPTARSTLDQTALTHRLDHCGTLEHSPKTNVMGESRRRCGADSASPGADVGQIRRVPAQMWGRWLHAEPSTLTDQIHPRTDRCFQATRRVRSPMPSRSAESAVQCSACTIRRAMFNIHHATCTMHVACTMHHACGLLHARCSMQYARCSMHHARCSMQHAPCRTQRPTCNTACIVPC
jgi:hypothetical protein